MLGSYSADPKPRVTEVISDDFPSGMMARGTYTVISKVIDIDNQVWLGTSISSIVKTPYQNTNQWSRLEMAAQDCEGLVRAASDTWTLSVICGCRPCNVAPLVFICAMHRLLLFYTFYGASATMG